MASPAAATKHVTLQAERMQQVCEAFLAQDALAVIVGMLAEPLSRHPKMTDRDTALVELVITFLRNLLAATVPLPGVSPAAVEGGRRIRAGLVQRLFNDDVLDLVLLMAQHARERPFRSQATVLMDIFLNVFAGTSPTQLLGAEAALEAAKNARAVAAAATAANRARGGQPRRGPSAPLPTPSLPLPTVGRSVTRFGPARQQFAGAVYVRRHMDHANSVVVRHNPSRKELPNLPQVVDPRQAKAQRKDAISSAVANAGGGAVASASATNSGRAAAPPPAMALRDAQLAVRLNGLMARFLDEAYTPLMGQLFKDARAGLGVSRLEEEDFERFARFVATCTQYVRLREEAKLQARMAGGKEGKAGSGGDGTGDQIEAEDDEASPFECISSTMGWDAFHLVQILFSQAAEAHAARARAKVKLFSPFSLLYSLGPLLREMLLTLDLARVAGNAADRRAADRLQRRLLHDDGKDSGLLWALTRLIKDYNYQHQTRAYAVHLVEVLHVVLGTLDRVAADPSGFRVRKDAGRAHNSAAKGKKPAANKGNATPEAVQAEADAVPADEGHGDGAAGVAAADGSEGGDMDAADNAEGLTTEPSGQANAATGEEEGVETASQATADPASAPDTSKEDDKDHHEVEEEQTPAPEEDKAQPEEERVEDDDEPYTAPQAPAYKEVVIDLPQRLRKACAQPALVHFYTWLLRGYRTNGALANEAIVSFLERIAAPAPTGLGLHAMLWQLSVIRLFHTILTDPAVKNDPGHARLLKLCLTVTRTLLKRLAPDLTEAQARLEEARQEEEEAMALEAALGPEEAGEAVQGAKEKRRRAEAEIKAKEGAAALGFIEILFWKGPALAEILQAEYHWEVSSYGPWEGFPFTEPVQKCKEQQVNMLMHPAS